MKNRKLMFTFLMCFSILINVPAVLCMTSAPIVYVSGDDSGDFNCNGTDDHIQINQALQFVAESSDYTTVYLEGPFTYVINDTLLIGNNTTLEGDSTVVIKLADHADWPKEKPMIKQMDSAGNHDITIKNFTIDGNREGNDDVISGNGYYNLIHLKNCQNIDVHDMNLTNNHGDGLKIDSCSNIDFHDNVAYLLGHDVLYASNCLYVEAYNNTITCRTNSGLRVYNTNHVSFYNNNITSRGSGGAGIEIQKHGNTSMNDIEIHNNTIYRTALSGIWIFGSGSYSPSSTNVSVHHNQIYDTGTGNNNKNIGGVVSDGFNVLIENNVIDGTYGAAIAQKNVYSSSILDGSGYVITVRNNIITNTTRPSSAGGDGFGVLNLLTGTHSFILQNNCFYNNSGGDYSGVDASSADIQADPQYADRENHDYHLKSKTGRWDGNDWVSDSVSSPCIDAGYPLSDYSNEPKPNGNRINIGPDGNTAYASKSEPSVPVANFTADLTVQFTDTSINNPTSWLWDFGDGDTSTEQNPVHVFSGAGTYTVTLVATNAGGSSYVRSMVIAVNRVLTPPVADFTANKNEGYAPLTVRFTDTSTYNPTGWQWNFGDSSTSIEQNPVHVFSGAGTYTVTLVATNGDGSSDAKPMDIKVNRVLTPPVADFTANTTEGYAPLTVKFTDTSTYNPTGWQWNFGDGQTSIVRNPEHTFSAAGVYTVSLVATNGDGSSGEKTMDITAKRVPTPPVADFTAKQTGPLTVQFNDLSLNEILERIWTFGDGSTSTEANPVHAYAAAGTYEINLTVSNADGNDTTSKKIAVTGESVMPKASFTATPQFGRAPLTVRFTDNSANAASIKWDFGDKSEISTESNPVHIYRTTGFFTVKLTATNGDKSNTASKTIFVTR
ncbi:MAG: PKD domain-containing protein [Methanosarcina sp.]|nr:PKD domain-containing protein [Methanosarcina sp.]